MTSAAQALRVAQPSLGAQMRALEEELGAPLLTRHSRGVTPTRAGALLHERAQKILADVETMRADVEALASAAPDVVALGAPPTVMTLIGPQLMLDAREALLGAQFSLVEERSVFLLEALERGELTLAFVWNAPEKPSLERTPLFEEEMLLLTAPQDAPSADPVTFAQALRHDLAIAGERGMIRSLVQAEARRLALPLKLAFEVHSLRAMKALVARGGVATIAPRSLCIEELADGSLVARRIVEPCIARALWLVRPARRPALTQEARLAAFIDALVGRMAALIGPSARRL